MSCCFCALYLIVIVGHGCVLESYFKLIIVPNRLPVHIKSTCHEISSKTLRSVSGGRYTTVYEILNIQELFSRNISLK